MHINLFFYVSSAAHLHSVSLSHGDSVARCFFNNQLIIRGDGARGDNSKISTAVAACGELFYPAFFFQPCSKSRARSAGDRDLQNRGSNSNALIDDKATQVDAVGGEIFAKGAIDKLFA